MKKRWLIEPAARSGALDRSDRRRLDARVGRTEADEHHVAAQVGAAGPVRRVLRGEPEGLLQGRGAERDAEERRPEHHPGAGRRLRAGPVRRRLAAEPPRSPRQGHRSRERRPGVRPVGDDAADLEVERDQHDREDEGQEGRQLARREPVRAVRRADEERHGPVAQQGRDDRPAAVRHGALPEPSGRFRVGDDLQRAGAGARVEEPEDRQALPAVRPERDQDAERRDRNARGRALLDRQVAQELRQPGDRRQVHRGLAQGLDLLPRPPGRVRLDDPEGRADPAQGPPDVDDERDQQARLAVCRKRDRRHEQGRVHPDGGDREAVRRDQEGAVGRLPHRPGDEGRREPEGERRGRERQRAGSPPW